MPMGRKLLLDIYRGGAYALDDIVNLDPKRKAAAEEVSAICDGPSSRELHTPSYNDSWHFEIRMRPVSTIGWL
jgi:hypothetical protein